MNPYAFYVKNNVSGFPVLLPNMLQLYDVEHRGIKQLFKVLEASKWCQGSVPRAKGCPMAVQNPGKENSV